MDAKELIKIMDRAERLKCNTRHSWTSSGRHESVAEHSWRLSLFAMLVADEFPEADMDKVIKMCIIHDLGEAITGDIPSFHKTEEDAEREKELLAEWLESFPEPFASKMKELLDEMEQQESQEAAIYGALDKLEAVIQHNEADISTWLPLEYDLQLTYGAEQTEFSDYFKGLKQELNRQTRLKIEKEGMGNDGSTE